MNNVLSNNRETARSMYHTLAADMPNDDFMDEIDFEEMMATMDDMSEDDEEEHLLLLEDMILRGMVDGSYRASASPISHGGFDEEQSYYRMLQLPAGSTSASVINATNRSTTNTTTTSTTTAEFVCESALPVEVWERIMINIDPFGMDTIAQVSKQHLAITKSPSFRARYFYARHRPCEAIYRASCLCKIFTPAVLKCLLSMGAVMSRYFVQQFCMSHFSNTGYPHSRLRYTHFWASKVSTATYSAVLSEGLRLYGDKLILNSAVSEGTTIRNWVESRNGFSTLNEVVDEIFKVGRFAVFASEDDANLVRTLCTVVAAHPQLVEVLETNGYRFSPLDQREIVASIFKDFENDEEKLYTKIDSILTCLPCWKPGVMACKKVVLHPYKNHFEVLPFTQAGRTLLVENDGLGPVKASLKVVKRLYDEKRAFADLDILLPLMIEKDLLEERQAQPDHANTYRILANYFPEQVKMYRVDFTVAYICQFQKKMNGLSTEDVERATQILFDAIGDLMLDRKQLIEVLCSEQITCDKLLSAAINAGLFGPPTHVNVEKVIDELINACLIHPMRGARVDEIASMAKEMACKPRPAGRKGQMMYEGNFERQLEDAVLDWEFVLDYLRPDAKSASKHKLRTPLAWMVAGSLRSSCNSYRGSVHTLPDPHHLFPTGHRLHRGCETIELDFADTRQATRELRKREHDAHKHGQKTKCEKRVLKETSPPSPGWKQLGHADSLQYSAGEKEPSADDSGVFLADESDKAVAGGVSATATLATAATPVSTSRVSEATMAKSTAGLLSILSKRRRRIGASPTGKIGAYPSYSMQVYRMSCAPCSSSVYCAPLWPAAGVKETVTALMKLLDADSPAMRDVVLAHALVNGNISAVEQLMLLIAGYDTQRPVKDGESNKLDERRAHKTVLPTLAHLQILQAVERKPVSTFIDDILQGAPFKRGHVKSSHIVVRKKEKDPSLRREWYGKTGFKDDRSSSALYREKSRLEEIDKQARAKARKNKAASKKGTKTVQDENADLAGSPSAMGGTSGPTARRSHPARSSRKAVVYNEENGASSDVEEAEAVKGRETVLAAPVKTKATGKKVCEADLFGVESELSDAESEKKEDSETEDGFFDDEDEYSESEYALSAEDAPQICFELNRMSYSMTIKQMLQRGKSLQLWAEHMRLLMWFERRKDRLAREKAAQAQRPPARSTAGQQRQQAAGATARVGKSKFALGINDAIKKIEALLAEMEKQLGPALKARKKEVAKKKRAAKLKKLAKGSPAGTTKDKSQSETSTNKAKPQRRRAKKRKAETDVEEEKDGSEKGNSSSSSGGDGGSTTASRTSKKRRVTFNRT